MKKNINITEEQYRFLRENAEVLLEALEFKRQKGTDNRIVSYHPGENGKIDDTIFNDDKSLKVRKVLLPKSNVMSYNLYNIKSMDVNKALKHGVDMKKRTVIRDDGTMSQFINRSVMLIKHLIGNRPVDIITFPQSSSPFNREITGKLINMYPQSEGIRLRPELLVKNVRNIYVNVDAARGVGLSDEQIHKLQTKVSKWKRDEDIRDVRRKIDVLQSQIAEYLSQRKGNRGAAPKRNRPKEAAD